MSSWHPHCRDGETKAQRGYMMCPRSPIKDGVDWDPGILTRALNRDACLPRGHRGRTCVFVLKLQALWGTPWTWYPSQPAETAPCHLFSPPKWFSFSPPCLIFKLHISWDIPESACSWPTYVSNHFSHIRGSTGGFWEGSKEVQRVGSPTHHPAALSSLQLTRKH